MKRISELSLQPHLLIHRIGFWIGLILIIIGYQLSPQGSLHLIAWLGIVVVLLSNLWRILFIRCPHCGSGLFGTNAFPDYCPDCGKKLLDHP